MPLLHVQIESILPTGAVATLGAGEWFFAGVGEDVVSVMLFAILAIERSRTNGANQGISSSRKAGRRLLLH